MASNFDNVMGVVGRDSLMSFMASATAITYQPADEADVALKAILGPVTERKNDDPLGEAVTVERTVTIATDPACQWGGIVDPQRGDVLVIDGFDWAVSRAPAIGSGLAELYCVRMARSERSSQGYRRNSN